MLSYQHAYHAGSFADVHKHLALFGLLATLQAKSSAITLVDTHAGRGLYPLADAQTRQVGEYRDGIAPVWAQRDTLAAEPLLGDWLEQLADLQTGRELRVYPGSPWWFAQLQRRQDPLSLFELHPGEHRSLDSQRPLARKQIRRIHADGLASLTKMQPVATPRLCALIDPSYEVKTEYRDVLKTFKQVAKKTRHAVILAWYPLLADARHRVLTDGLARAGIPKIWQSELVHHTLSAGQSGMYGSGLVLLNPPYQLDERLEAGLAAIARVWGGQARHEGRWLAGE